MSSILPADEALEGTIQLQGNATLLQVNTVSVNQLPAAAAATYRLIASCSTTSLCSSQPTFLHFSRIPSGVSSSERPANKPVFS